MKKVEPRRKPAAQPQTKKDFPLERRNYMLIGAGLLLVVIGLFIMALGGEKYSFMVTGVSVLVMLAGYILVIYAIMKRFPKPEETAL